MTQIIELQGTEKRLYQLVAPLVMNNNAEVLKALLEKVIAKMDKDKYLSSVTFVEHQEIFKELGFSVEKEWKRYVKMNKEN